MWRRVSREPRRRELLQRRLPPPSLGSQVVQVLRTYPARHRAIPFAPDGERSIARAYLKALRRARALVYIEDQYLWGTLVSNALAAALRTSPELRMIIVVPRYPDRDGRVAISNLMAARGSRGPCTTWRTSRARRSMSCPRQGRGHRRCVGDGGLGQPQPALLDP
jgi:hypothetical protein